MKKRDAAFLLFSLTLAAAWAGCASEEGAYYNQEAQAPEAPAPGVSVRYAVPAADPRGGLYVTSLGAKALPVPGQQDVTAPYMHVRIAAENEKDSETWQLDARDQIAIYDGQTQLPVAFADGSSGAGKPVTIAPGQRGALDLFFPVIGGVPPQSVEIAWKLRRGQTEITERTPYLRTQPANGQAPSDAAYAYRPYTDSHVYVGVGVGVGWWWGGPYWAGPWNGGPWWYDPWWYPGWYFHYPRYYSAPYRAYGPYHGGGYYGGGYRGGYGGGYGGGYRGGGYGGGGTWHGGGGAYTGGGSGGGWHGGGGGGGRAVHGGHAR